MEFVDIESLRDMNGLRLVVVGGTPSPWGQAAKAMIEYKGIEFACGRQEPGGENRPLQDWAGVNSAPVVVWNDEAPLDRWDDILMLLERLAPQRPLLPEDRRLRARVLGLSHEICAELGLGWNRRLEMFKPAMQSGQPAPAIASMAGKYRYNESDVAAAPARVAASLHLLSDELTTQRERGCAYFVGDMLTAVDFYWAAFCNLIKLAPPEIAPVSEDFRAVFETVSTEITDALSPILLEHRDHMMAAHFCVPMEF